MLLLFVRLLNRQNRVADRKPHVLALDRLEAELLALALRVVKPVARLAIVDPRALHVLRSGKLDIARALHPSETQVASDSEEERTYLLGAKVPHALHVVVLDECARQSVAVAGHNVDHTAGQIRRVKHLQHCHD